MRGMEALQSIDQTTTNDRILIGVIVGLIVLLVSTVGRSIARGIRSGILNLLRRAIGEKKDANEAPPPIPSTMPDTTNFVGRTALVKELVGRVRGRETRIVGLIGSAGVGKTLLAARLVEETSAKSWWRPLRRSFDGSVWLDCRQVPPLSFDLAISQLIRSANPAVTDAEFGSLAPRDRIDRLIHELSERRLLVVLDNIEALCAPGGDVPAGTFVDEQYEQLVAALTRDAHKSVVVLTSRERPQGLANAGAAYHQPEITGLGEADARQLLSDNGVEGTNDQLDDIARRVNRTPLWLLQAAAIARDEHSDAAYLLNHPQLLTSEGDQLLSSQLSRIAGSDAGRLLSAMAVFRLPAPLHMLRFSLGANDEPAEEPETRRALAALRDRSLIDIRSDRGEPDYTLHPQLQRYLLEDGTDRADAHRQAASGWLSFRVQGGRDARTVDDVLPWIEAHHHLLASGQWQDAVGLSMTPHFGPIEIEDLTEFLTRRGYSSLRLELEFAAASSASRDEAPAIWGSVQNNLGLAYASLPTGDRTANLKSAITAYEAALQVVTEADHPQEWAMGQNNLGAAFAQLPTGDRSENLQSAIARFEAALRVYTEADYPGDWAMTQNNLGNAFTDLQTGDRDENLKSAIAAHEAALRVYTEADLPVEWARLQNNLAGTLTESPGDENVTLAIAACEAALRVRTEDDYPADWATTQGNLGFAYLRQKTGDLTENLKSAITAFEAAMRVFTEADYPAEWAIERRTSSRLSRPSRRPCECSQRPTIRRVLRRSKTT